jgi:hypothetical protein
MYVNVYMHMHMHMHMHIRIHTYIYIHIHIHIHIRSDIRTWWVQTFTPHNTHTHTHTHTHTDAERGRAARRGVVGLRKQAGLAQCHERCRSHRKAWFAGHLILGIDFFFSVCMNLVIQNMRNLNSYVLSNTQF